MNCSTVLYLDSYNHAAVAQPRRLFIHAAGIVIQMQFSTGNSMNSVT